MSNLPSFGIRRRMRQRARGTVGHLLEPNTLLGKSYVPETTPKAGLHFPDVSPQDTQGEVDGLAVPPMRLMNSWNRDAAEYLESGRQHARTILHLARDQGIDLADGDQVLDWGCGAGRVLRHLAREDADLWGVDVDEACIRWAKGHLSPPCRFVNGTHHPHLPFPDGSLTLLYGVSVMTHLQHFRDMWLMEIRRLLKPGGVAILSVHDEHTLEHIREYGPKGALGLPDDLGPVIDHEVAIIHGDTWATTFTFFNGDYLRRDWGQYLEVVEIRPSAIGFQSAVVLRR